MVSTMTTTNRAGTAGGAHGRRRATRAYPRGPVASLAAVVLALSGLGVVAGAAHAEPVAIGSGGYTTDRVGPSPEGCAPLASDPRAYLTANAPAGAVPTNDWWSSLALQADRTAPTASRCTRTRSPTSPPATGSASPTPPTPAHLRHRDRRGGVPLPVRPGLHRRRRRAGRARRQGRRLDRLDRHAVLDRRHPHACARRSATACRSSTSRSPAATRSSPSTGSRRRSGRNSGADDRLHGQRPRLRRLRARPARPGPCPGTTIAVDLAGRATSPSRCCPPAPASDAADRRAALRASTRRTRTPRHRHPGRLRATTRRRSTRDHHVRVHHHGRARAPRTGTVARALPAPVASRLEPAPTPDRADLRLAARAR